MGGTPGAPPPLGHCPRDVINLKNAPTLGHSQAPPLDIVRVTSSTFQGWNKIAKGWNKIAKRWNKIAKGWNKILGMGNWGGGGSSDPPWLRACISTRSSRQIIVFCYLREQNVMNVHMHILKRKPQFPKLLLFVLLGFMSGTLQELMNVTNK